MNKEVLDAINELLKPLLSSLAVLTSDISEIKQSLVSKEILDEEIKIHKDDILLKLEQRDSKIASLEDSLRSQQNLLSSIQKQIKDFQNEPSTPYIVKAKKKVIVIGDSLVRHLNMKTI